MVQAPIHQVGEHQSMAGMAVVVATWYMAASDRSFTFTMALYMVIFQENLGSSGNLVDES